MHEHVCLYYINERKISQTTPAFLILFCFMSELVMTPYLILQCTKGKKITIKILWETPTRCLCFFLPCGKEAGGKLTPGCTILQLSEAHNFLDLCVPAFTHLWNCGWDCWIIFWYTQLLSFYCLSLHLRLTEKETGRGNPELFFSLEIRKLNLTL